MDDRELVAVQIGRPSRASIDTVYRCHLSLPVVVRVPPLLEDGTPFPTLFWLTCPLAVKRVSRLESGGGVKSMERRAARVPEFGAALDAAHARYEAQRDALLPPGADPRPSGGVAGAKRGVKCLHAHYADTRGGNPNPVGELVIPWVEPLDCEVPCIGRARRPGHQESAMDRAALTTMVEEHEEQLLDLQRASEAGEFDHIGRIPDQPVPDGYATVATRT